MEQEGEPEFNEKILLYLIYTIVGFIALLMIFW
jgi:hypothetical protein